MFYIYSNLEYLGTTFIKKLRSHRLRETLAKLKQIILYFHLLSQRIFEMITHVTISPVVS